MGRTLWLMMVIAALGAPIVHAADNTSGTGAAVRSASQSRVPEIAQGADDRVARLVARAGDLAVTKAITRERSLQIDLVFNGDYVTVTAQPNAPVRVSRGGRTMAIASAQAFQAAQQLLAGSEAIFAARVLLSERENTSALEPDEMSLLSSLAFVASLVGDVDAPRRLSARFLEKYRGIVRQVGYTPRFSCYSSYQTEVNTSWNSLQQCMGEANDDSSMFRAAFRRVGCNTIWAIESDAAWFEFLKCISIKIV